MDKPPDLQPIYEKSTSGALRQGEIVSLLRQYKRVGGYEQPEFDAITHPFAIVMTQDCDLDWDFRAQTDSSLNGKRIPNILFCEVMLASELRAAVKTKEFWKRMCQNKDERYQCLEAISIELDAKMQGIEDLAVDFKHYFTLPTDDVYGQVATHAIRRCWLSSPFLQHFCGRFWYFQNRVALPREHSVNA